MQDQVIEVTARSSDGWRPCERPSSPSRRHFLRRAAAIGCTTLLGRRMARAVAPTPNRQDRSLVVWFAHNICTATDAGKVLDEASVGGIFERCVDLGFNTVYWDPRYVGPALYHSKVVAPFDKRPWIEGVPGFSVTPTHARHAQAMADLLARFDPYDVAVREAERHGVKFIAQTRIFDRWFPILKDRFYEEHPECLMLDRSGKFPLWGIPCYAEPGTRDYCLAEIRELIERGAAGVSLALESHQIRYWPSELGAWRPDSFGFNPPVVEQYQRRHGVNVLKEAPEPAKWHELHGDLFTEFLRLVKKELGEKLLIVGAHPEGFVGYGGNAVDVQHPDYQAPPTGFAGPMKCKPAPHIQAPGACRS